MASDPGKFSCEICSENLRSKTGACVATVSLFSETSNKEFSNACNGKPVVFADLLRVLGIVLVQDRQARFVKSAPGRLSIAINCLQSYNRRSSIVQAGNHLREIQKPLVRFKLLRNQGKKIAYLNTSDRRLELPPLRSVKKAMNRRV